MRLRESNKGKRFRPPKYFSGLDSSDDSDGPTGRQELSSEDGSADAGGDAEAIGNASDDNDELNNSSDSEFPAEVEETTNIGRRKSLAKDNPSEKREEKALGYVQPYPSDPAAKWTRTYVGPVARYSRLPELCMHWYGDREGYNDVINGFLSLWSGHELYIPRLITLKQKHLAQSPWMPDDFRDNQETKFLQWYANYQATRLKPQITSAVAQSTALRWYLPQAQTPLTVLLGPHHSQKEFIFNQGRSMPFTSDGLPNENPGKNSNEECGGWLMDVGGIPLSMDWAPTKGDVDQLLAMAVIPYSDQAFYQRPEDAPPDATLKQGSIQIWRIAMQKNAEGNMCLSAAQPKLVSALCFDWGRIVRMKWCPVPLTVRDRLGLLALLTNNGKVKVVEIKQPANKRESQSFGKIPTWLYSYWLEPDPVNNTAEEINEPFATLELKHEYHVEITCFTWINVNRIAVGYSDGSVGVWSLYPCLMLQRHPIHSSPVMDITSSYPSHPFIVATLPIGGVAIVTDLSRPNAELAYCSNLLITLHANLLAWSEHMRGYVMVWPASFPTNNAVSFMAARAFPQSRLLLCVSGQPTCLDVGTCHPFVLVGSTDGSLWLTNIFRKVLFYKKKSRKQKLFQHEYQASSIPTSTHHDDNQESPRGVSRLLQGFKSQENGHPKATRAGAQIRKRHEVQKKKIKKGNAKSTTGEGNVGEKDGQNTTNNELEPELDEIPVAAGDVVTHDPLNRISAVAWNPNVEFSWWAAAAMGSGLIRIMDLGGEQEPAQEADLLPRRRRKNGTVEADPEEDSDEDIDEQWEEEGSDDE